MVKRLISSNSSELLSYKKKELKQSILASEGRVVCSENVVMAEPVSSGITNAEVARAFGADLILLNTFDTLNPLVKGLDETEDVVGRLKKLVGKPIGLNLEPVDTSSEMLESFIDMPKGRMATVETIKRAEEMGFDFVCFTGNPGSGVSTKEISEAVKIANEHFSGLIIAGKMHAGGSAESVVPSIAELETMIENGADVILLPAVGTVPGHTDEQQIAAVRAIKKLGGLTMSAIGTSQETSNREVIQSIAIRNKIAGVDIQHIGDAGVGGIANPMNIYELSVAIRGERHTVSSMARSINR